MKCVNGAWSLMEGLGPPSSSASPPSAPTPAQSFSSKPRDSYQQYVAQLRTFSENLNQLEGRRQAHAPWRARRAPVTAWPAEEEAETQSTQEEEMVAASCDTSKQEQVYRSEILRVIEGRFVSQFHTQLGLDQESPGSRRFMRRLESADEGCCDTLALPGDRGARGPSPASSCLSSARSSSPGDSEDEELGPCPAWRHPGWRTQRCASSDSAVVLDCHTGPECLAGPECQCHTWGDEEELLNEEETEGAARAWRTPSVVVSDFSDETPPVWLDLGGLDENERCRRLSDCSSCSGGLCAPQRKVSDCSTCSTLSGDEESSTPELRPLRRQPAAKVGTTFFSFFVTRRYFNTFSHRVFSNLVSHDSRELVKRVGGLTS